MTDPIFYDAVDTLYHTVMDNSPQFLQDRPKTSAFVLGGSGIYGVVKSLQWTSKNIMDYYVSNFDEKILPILEKGCIAAMAAAPFLCYLVAPEATKEVMDQHQVYTSGMVGVWLGSIIGAGQDLFNRYKQKPLEETLSE